MNNKEELKAEALTEELSKLKLDTALEWKDRIAELNASEKKRKRTGEGLRDPAAVMGRVQNPCLNEEELAMIIHHNCVKSPTEPNSTLFSQALSTVLMRGTLVSSLVGDAQRWSHLSERKCEPINIQRYNTVSYFKWFNIFIKVMNRIHGFLNKFRKKPVTLPSTNVILRGMDFERREQAAAEFLKSSKGQV